MLLIPLFLNNSRALAKSIKRGLSDVFVLLEITSNIILLLAKRLTGTLTSGISVRRSRIEYMQHQTYH